MKKKKASEQDVSYGIRLSPALLKQIQGIAHEDKRSINSEVVWILEQYIQERKGEQRDKKL